MAALVAACEERQIIDADVRRAMIEVPREPFAPDRFWVGDGVAELVDKAVDPEGWLRAVYSNQPLVTQHDDGSGSGKMVSTSSLSAPSIVYRMLYDASINASDTGFEAGTGSGWTAALMARWVEPGNITTMEYDPDVAMVATRNLLGVGLPLTVITGDASFGCADRAPFDRVIWTCAVKRVPFSSVEQTKVGGLIVAPWVSPGVWQAVVRLRVVEPGHAMGYFTAACSFMLNRAQRSEVPEASSPVPDSFDSADGRPTGLDCADLFTDAEHARSWALSLRVGPLEGSRVQGEEQTGLSLFQGESWSYTITEQDGASRVWQGGPRKIWDEIEAAQAWYEDHGEPGITRFGMSVSKEAETVWLDHPGNVLLAQGEASVQRSWGSH